MTTKKIIESVFKKYRCKRITVFCCRYIYHGELIAYDEDSITLGDDPGIIYQTGPFNDPKIEDFQSLCTKEWTISRQAIESFGLLKMSK